MYLLMLVASPRLLSRGFHKHKRYISAFLLIKYKTMNLRNQEKFINMAFGEVTALFMSQEIKGTEIEMPTEELTRISTKLVDALNK